MVGNHEVAGSTPVDGSKRSTKAVGDAAEAAVLFAFVRAGKKVLLPYGEDHRYDLVVDDGGRFIRVQVKAGRLRRGCVLFNTCSMHGGEPSRNYSDGADIFGVYCPDNGEVYLVPVEDVPRRMASLRVDPVRNGQSAGIRLADQYRFLPS